MLQKRILYSVSILVIVTVISTLTTVNAASLAAPISGPISAPLSAPISAQIIVPTFSFISPPQLGGGVILNPENGDNDPHLIQAPEIPGSGSSSALNPPILANLPKVTITSNIALAPGNINPTKVMATHPATQATTQPTTVATQVIQVGGRTIVPVKTLISVKKCTGYITYINNSLYFVDYPCTWAVTEAENNVINQVTFLSPDNDAQAITAYILEQSNATLEDFAKTRIAQIQGQYENLKVLTKGATKMGGEPAYKITYSFTANGVPMVGVNVLSKHNDVFYGIVATTSKATYTKNQKIIEKIAGSFKFR